MIETLFTPDLGWSLVDTKTNPVALLDQEAELVNGALPGRVAEFAGGRAAARDALHSAGCPRRTSTPLLRDGDRIPIWPAGFTGSISHSAGICIAVATQSTGNISVGIDIECRSMLRTETAARIACNREREAWRDWAANSANASAPADILLFSAKESVYKALFPLLRQPLPYGEMTVYPVPDGNHERQADRALFRCELLGTLASARGFGTIDGRFMTHRGCAISLCVVSPG